MNQFLKIRLNRDDDGTAGIIAIVQSENFSGKGEAWFNLTEISSFVEQIEDFAKTTKTHQ